MELVEAAHRLVQAAAHELTLFAAVGFLIGGLDDLLIDCVWIARTLWRRATVYTRFERATAATLTPSRAPGRLAVCVPTCGEAGVIGPMLRHALGAFGGGDYVIWVGCYADDPDTIAAARAIGDPRIRIAINPRPSPTTKADNLNSIWRAIAASGEPVKGIVLHDAEDVVHSAELAVFDSLLDRFDFVQLPVRPLIDGATAVERTYADEFAEAHNKLLVVREWLGAGVPSAGVGCAVRFETLRRIAGERGGLPFAADSLTEDYELGLSIAAVGGRGAFVRLPAADGRQTVCTRAHFPSRLDTAVRQRARWTMGIALAGWDRLGWRGGLAERWMRLHDRRSLLAAIVILCGYAALALQASALVLAEITSLPPITIGPALQAILLADLFLLIWRLAMRAGFVARWYGWRQGLAAIPRTVLGNIVAMMAARRAVGEYLKMRRGGRPFWDKTDHVFPAVAPAE